MERKENKAKVVIIGGGFGGLKAAREFKNKPFEVTLIDRKNHHLFQPLLYQVATAGLNPGDIASPIRYVLRNNTNTEVLLSEVTGVDTENQEVLMEDKRLPYDFLIIATGARHSYFGKDEWEQYAPGLKSVADATRIRKKILLAFENAEKARTEEERRAMLTFIIVGAGPTGVELAGSIAELARRSLKHNFRHFNPGSARILLVEAGQRILGGFPEKLANDAEQELKRRGVEVRIGQPVKHIDAQGVMIDSERINACTIIWAAGVKASPAGDWLHVPVDRSGRVIVDPFLHPQGLSNVYVIGDTAAAKDKEGNLLPGVAPVAMQQGIYAAKEIIRLTLSGGTPQPFKYRDKGSLATVGRSYAIARVAGQMFSGVFAWFLWLFVHIMYLIGFRNRTLVLFQWMVAYLTFQRGVRLIVTEEEAESPLNNSKENKPSKLLSTDGRSQKNASSKDGATTNGAVSINSTQEGATKKDQAPEYHKVSNN